MALRAREISTNPAEMSQIKALRGEAVKRKAERKRAGACDFPGWPQIFIPWNQAASVAGGLKVYGRV